VAGNFAKPLKENKNTKESVHANHENNYRKLYETETGKNRSWW
jgi:hypothetical protein